MSTSIMLAGQELNGHDRLGAWKVTSLSGWWDTPNTKQDVKERDRADGAWSAPSYFESRQIGIRGRLITDSHDAQHSGMERLSSLLSVKEGMLTVRGHGADQWASVNRRSLEFSPRTNKYVTFEMELEAADPRKFGELRQWTVRQNQSVAVYHYGSYWATPKFTVTGSFPGGYVIRLAARSYVVTRPLLSGETHTVDYRDGRLRVNGAVVFGGVSSSNVYLVEPGQLDTLAFEPLTSGTGQLVCSLPDTYM